MRIAFFAMVLLTTAAGCGGMGRTTLCNPGPAKLQQLRAERFDPYPEIISGSDPVGARPRDYDKPSRNPAPDPWPWSRNAAPR